MKKTLRFVIVYRFLYEIPFEKMKFTIMWYALLYYVCFISFRALTLMPKLRQALVEFEVSFSCKLCCCVFPTAVTVLSVFAKRLYLDILFNSKYQQLIRLIGFNTL